MTVVLVTKWIPVSTLPYWLRNRLNSPIFNWRLIGRPFHMTLSNWKYNKWRLLFDCAATPLWMTTSPNWPYILSALEGAMHFTEITQLTSKCSQIDLLRERRGMVQDKEAIRICSGGTRGYALAHSTCLTSLDNRTHPYNALWCGITSIVSLLPPYNSKYRTIWQGSWVPFTFVLYYIRPRNRRRLNKA